MDTNQRPVFAASHINLEADPQFEASSEVRQRVLRRVLEQSAMRDDERLRFWLAFLAHETGGDQRDQSCEYERQTIGHEFSFLSNVRE